MVDLTILTIDEAKKMLRVSVDTIHKLRKNGYLASIQHVPNGKVYFTRQAILDYIAAKEAQATAPAVKNARQFALKTT